MIKISMSGFGESDAHLAVPRRLPAEYRDYSGKSPEQQLAQEHFALRERLAPQRVYDEDANKDVLVPAKRLVPREKKETIERLAQTLAPEAMLALLDVAKRDPSGAARVAAANAILDRAFGKPTQSVSVGGQEGSPIEVIDVTKRDAFRRLADVMGRAFSDTAGSAVVEIGLAGDGATEPDNPTG